ncbi:MAG TPA: histidine kinase [Sphingobium sp.]
MNATARQALILTAIIWLAVSYGSYVVAELIAGRHGFISDLPIDMPAVLLVALLAYGLYPVAERTSSRPPIVRWWAMLVAVIVIAFAQSIVNMFENRILGVIPSLDAAHLPLIRERFGRNFLSHLYLCSATGALFIFLVEARRTEAQRLERLRAEALAADARMAALRLQMNPHFLFNALNGVSSLIMSGETEAAETMVSRLADFLRRTLKADPAVLVPLSEELGTVDAYLQIEQARFEGRMRVEIDCAADLKDIPVPSFVLQPLAENAVKHGVARSRVPVTVHVRARRQGHMLLLSVQDDAEGKAEAAPGLGLGNGNIAERLKGRYGLRASITGGATARGFVAEVRIPLD